MSYWPPWHGQPKPEAACVGVSSMLGSVNYLTTIIQMRAPGMTMFRLPMTIWGMFITAVLQAFALPVLTAATFMQVLDRMLGTGFFLPEGAFVPSDGPALIVVAPYRPAGEPWWRWALILVAE